ncbi:putative acyltransferase [Hyphodiscus hymeniophilus]|uniref:Acyltransferase n=1 Tax=Hyphodiscus hymeniophilus TaxID=353542 RepID=A0A9P6VR40_9HELO|nr:putative acyltransferase [Hyphodiscus hymeniophilus]
MENPALRQRGNPTKPDQPVVETKGKTVEAHPAGDIKHGGPVEILRLLLVITYFLSSTFSICLTQFFGVPLYWYNKDLYYAYMALTKQSFGIFVTTLTQWWTPTVVRISGDASVAGQLKKTEDGRVECDFPDRMVLIANHQLYSDWLYLWWIAYTNKTRMHGHIYIILKESLKYVPVIGWGMMFYGFIFISTKTGTSFEATEDSTLGPMSGSEGLDPMWLLLFPEGTNASDNGRRRSAQWAEKTGIKDMEHQLLPRSTGMYFCLNELDGTVEYVYDCTLAYEGIARGKFGQDYYSLRSMYLQGRPPPSVNMYWRRFAVKDIPLGDHEEFDLWLRERWYEKDALIDQYITTGRFPGIVKGTNGVTNGTVKEEHIETEVKLAHWWEVGNIFLVLATFGLVANILARVWTGMIYGKT